MQQYLNIIYYFDEPTGSWLPMPLSWEQHVPFVANRIDHIKVRCIFYSMHTVGLQCVI